MNIITQLYKQFLVKYMVSCNLSDVGCYNYLLFLPHLQRGDSDPPPDVDSVELLERVRSTVSTNHSLRRLHIQLAGAKWSNVARSILEGIQENKCLEEVFLILDCPPFPEESLVNKTREHNRRVRLIVNTDGMYTYTYTHVIYCEFLLIRCIFIHWVLVHYIVIKNCGVLKSFAADAVVD